jgi:hypothetical protein
MGSVLLLPLVRLIEPSGLFLPERFSVKGRLHERSAAAHFPLMCSFGVVMLQSGIQFGLQLHQRMIQFAPEGNLIKLLQDGFGETFADTVCLRMSRFGLVCSMLFIPR